MATVNVGGNEIPILKPSSRRTLAWLIEQLPEQVPDAVIEFLTSRLELTSGLVATKQSTGNTYMRGDIDGSLFGDPSGSSTTWTQIPSNVKKYVGGNVTNSVSLSQAQGYKLETDGTLTVMGHPNGNKLGVGDKTTYVVGATPDSMIGVSNIARMWDSGKYALTTDNKLKSVYSYSGGMPYPAKTTYPNPENGMYVIAENVQKAYGNDSEMAYIATDGSLYVWSSSANYGMLPSGTVTPTEFELVDTDVVDFHIANSYISYVKSNGQVLARGNLVYTDFGGASIAREYTSNNAGVAREYFAAGSGVNKIISPYVFATSTGDIWYKGTNDKAVAFNGTWKTITGDSTPVKVMEGADQVATVANHSYTFWVARKGTELYAEPALFTYTGHGFSTDGIVHPTHGMFYDAYVQGTSQPHVTKTPLGMFASTNYPTTFDDDTATGTSLTSPAHTTISMWKRIPGITNVDKIGRYSNSFTALKDDGTVWNYQKRHRAYVGELGSDSDPECLSNVPVADRWKQITAMPQIVNMFSDNVGAMYHTATNDIIKPKGSNRFNAGTSWVSEDGFTTTFTDVTTWIQAGTYDSEHYFIHSTGNISGLGRMQQYKGQDNVSTSGDTAGNFAPHTVYSGGDAVNVISSQYGIIILTNTGDVKFRGYNLSGFLAPTSIIPDGSYAYTATTVDTGALGIAGIYDGNYTRMCVKKSDGWYTAGATGFDKKVPGTSATTTFVDEGRGCQMLVNDDGSFVSSVGYYSSIMTKGSASAKILDEQQLPIASGITDLASEGTALIFTKDGVRYGWGKRPEGSNMSSDHLGSYIPISNDIDSGYAAGTSITSITTTNTVDHVGTWTQRVLSSEKTIASNVREIGEMYYITDSDDLYITGVTINNTTYTEWTQIASNVKNAFISNTGSTSYWCSNSGDLYKDGILLISSVVDWDRHPDQNITVVLLSDNTIKTVVGGASWTLDAAITDGVDIGEPGQTYTAIYASSQSLSALTIAGELRSRGSANTGQGTGAFAWGLVDTNVSTLYDTKGNRTTYYYKTDNSLWGYGYNTQSQIAEAIGVKPSIVETQIADVISFSWGYEEIFAVTSDNKLWVIGDNSSYNQLGLPAVSSGNTVTEWTEVLSGVSEVFGTDDDVAFCKKTDGTIWVAGKSWDYAHGLGELWGAGPTDGWVEVTALGTNTIKVYPAGGYSLALKSDGTLWAVGDSYKWRYGVDPSTPTYDWIEINNNVADMVGNGDQTTILKNDGTVWAIGYNYYGGFGLGQADRDDAYNNSTYHQSWVQIYTGASAIGAARYRSYVVDSGDGILYACGSNSSNRLGITTDIGSIVVDWTATSMSNVAAVYGGYENTYVKKNDGTVWSYGYGRDGALANGSFNDLQSNVWGEITDAGIDNIMATQTNSDASEDIFAVGKPNGSGGYNLWVSGDDASAFFIKSGIPTSVDIPYAVEQLP